MTYMRNITVPDRIMPYEVSMGQIVAFPSRGRQRTDGARQRLAAQWQVDQDGRLVCTWALEGAPASRVPPD